MRRVGRGEARTARGPAARGGEFDAKKRSIEGGGNGRPKRLTRMSSGTSFPNLLSQSEHCLEVFRGYLMLSVKH